MRTDSSKSDIVNAENPDENPGNKRRGYALIGGVVGVILLIVYLITAAYPSRLFSEQKEGEPIGEQPVPAVVHPVLPASPLKNSSAALVTSNNQVWAKLLKKEGIKYTAPSIQFFEDTISAYECGYVLPASGSFYCATDKEIYVDLSYFKAIQKQFPGSADLVQAYIVAHQQGHHIEALLGVTAKLEAARKRLSESDYKALTAKAEMLADYYAGVWAHYAWDKSFDDSDAAIAISEATQISAAMSKNDDIVVADPYTFKNLGGRANWFYKGFQSGELKGADSILTENDLR
jgi:predicted metalloprotease